MATNRNYTVRYRRKRNGKTDYKTRLKLLLSKKPRLVVRKLNNSIIAQIITYNKKGDNVLVSVTTNDLKKIGWKFHKGNLPSAYLVGLLIGKKAKKLGVKEVIFDLGINKSIHGSTYYASLKGVLDSGLNMPHDEKIIPSKDRISGKHIKDYALLLKKDPKKYNKQFSNYIKLNLNPEDITTNFEEIKNKILSEDKW